MTAAKALIRPLAMSLLAGLLGVGLSTAPSAPALAQGAPLSLIRDTEIETVLRSYLDPLLVAAGLNPAAVRLHLVSDQSINAFVAEGQNMFVNTGLLMTLETPNQIKGVLAHETGHMADGHLVRMSDGVRAATVPLLISMAAGIAAAAAGAADAGQAIMMAGNQIAERSFLSFTRTQESAADQAAIRYLEATQQSGQGMLQVFRRFAEQELLTDRQQDPFARSHPASFDRITALRAIVEASPYHDNKDSAEDQFAFDMIRAKLHGYIERPEVALRRYPATNTSKPARYGRAMAYFRQPNMAKALAEIDSLLAEEPDNPYFLEMKGQINVEMGRIQDGIGPYRRAVELMPDAPLIRIALAAALLATEDNANVTAAEQELQTALRQETDNSFGWYELAQVYGRQGHAGRAALATAERYFVIASYREAMQFAYRAQRDLPRGSTEWQRANDIMAIAQSQDDGDRRRN